MIDTYIITMETSLQQDAKTEVEGMSLQDENPTTGKLENVEMLPVPVKGNPKGIEIKGTYGGPRPGGGRPKGMQWESTKQKNIANREFRDRIIRSMMPLMNAQMSLAQGVQHLYVVRTIEEDGKRYKQRPQVVQDQETIEAYLAGELDNSEDEFFYITTEKPDNKALESLFDRALGKAVTHVEGNVTTLSVDADTLDPNELDAVKQAILLSVANDDDGEDLAEQPALDAIQEEERG